MTRENVPQLRFKGFEGEWENSVLNKFASLNPKNSSLPEAFVYIDLESVTDGHLIKENVIYKNEAPSRAQRVLNEKDILYQTVRPYQKNNLYFNKVGNYVASTGYAQIRTKNDSQFLFQFLHTEKLVANVMLRCTGTSYPAINSTDLSSIEISFPTLPEQQKIASFLSAVDEKIHQLSRKKKLLEQYKKGVMQQLFSGKLRFKDENGNNYPDWEEKKLGDVCKLNPKNSLLPSSFVYIDLESVVDGQLLKETRINLSEAPSRAQRLLSCEDILFQMVRPYQKNNLFFNKNGEYVASTGYAQLRAKESSMFLYQLIHTADFVNKVIDRCTGTSYPAINSTDLSNIEIAFPSLHEQQKIANFLSGIDGKIEQVKGELVKTQEFKKGLLQQLFV